MFISLHLLCRLEFAGWRFFTFTADGVEGTQTALLWVQEKKKFNFWQGRKSQCQSLLPLPCPAGIVYFKRRWDTSKFQFIPKGDFISPARGSECCFSHLPLIFFFSSCNSTVLHFPCVCCLLQGAVTQSCSASQRTQHTCFSKQPLAHTRLSARKDLVTSSPQQAAQGTPGCAWKGTWNGNLPLETPWDVFNYWELILSLI